MNLVVKCPLPWPVAMLLRMAVLMLPSGLFAATVTIPAVDDTSLFETNPDGDLGGTMLVAGTNQQYSRARALIRFDLSAMPAGAVVTGVEVQLYVTRRPDPDQHGGPVDSDFSLHRLFVSWGEGTGTNVTGSVASPGAATWNERHFGSTPWANPGGQIGTDFADTASASTAISNVGPYSWGSTPGLVDDVNAWIAHPDTNFGYMLISQGEAFIGSARRFGAIEQPGGLIPPAQLVITYDTVPEPGAFFLVAFGTACVAFARRRCRD